MATPMLRALRTHYASQARLIGIMRPYVEDILAGSDWLADRILYDRSSSDAQMSSDAVVEQLRERRIDQVVLSTNSLRAAWMAYRAGIPRRVGYVRYGRGPLLTDRLYPRRRRWRLTPVSAVDYYLELARTMGATELDRHVELMTTADEEHQAEQVWRRIGLRDEDRVVVLNNGGAYGGAKLWPTEYFAQLARRLAEEQQVTVVVLCGPAERHISRQMAQLANHPAVFSLAGERLGLGLSKAIIRRAQLLVSTDSGPRHIGAAFGVPTVNLFGPTDPRWSHNYNPRSIDLQHHVPCGPCARRECPLGHHRCMHELSVATVTRAASGLLGSQSKQRVA